MKEVGLCKRSHTAYLTLPKPRWAVMCPVHLFIAPISYIYGVPARFWACRSSRSPIPHDPIILPSIHHFPFMSNTHPTSTSANFQPIFDYALKAYQKRTKKDILTHPLAERLKDCNSASSILIVLQEQVQSSMSFDEVIRSGWTQRWPSFMPSQRHSEKVSVRYAPEHELVRGLLSYLFDRYSHLRRWSLSDFLSSFQCVPFLILSWNQL